MYFKRLIIVLPLLLASFSLQAQLLISSHYENDDIGIKTQLSDSWQLYTSRNLSPPSVQPNFPENKGPNDSPLFFGQHQSQRLFSRLLVEPYFDDLNAFGKALAKNLDAQGLTILNARILDDGSAMQIDYLHPGLGLYFVERLSRLEDSLILRMAFWTPVESLPEFAQEIAQGFDNTQVRTVVNAAPGYQFVWKQLPSRLPEKSMEGVDISVREKLLAATPQCTDQGASMLWQVSSPVMSSRGVSIHLLGSIHVGKPEFYPLHATVETLLREADNLVFEIDPASASDPDTAMHLQRQGMLPAGQTIDKVLSTQLYSDLRSVLQQLGIPEAGVQPMKPWLVALLLANLQANMLGYNAQYGLEAYLMQRKSADSKVLELESLNEQVDMLETLDPEAFLAYSLSEFDSSAQILEGLVQAWQCGDTNAMQALLESSDEALKAQAQVDPAMLDTLHEILFEERNKTMATGIEAFANTGMGDYFIVVGSAHLLGEGSILELLEAQGYQIEPVRLEQP